MAEPKTKPTRASVARFITALPDERVRRDCRTLVTLMKSATRKPAKMWGPSIVGFGDVHYVYASGREGDWFQIGFSPRKGTLTLYITGCLDQVQDLLPALGKHKTGKGCLHMRSLDDVDRAVLARIIRKAGMKRRGIL